MGAIAGPSRVVPPARMRAPHRPSPRTHAAAHAHPHTTERSFRVNASRGHLARQALGSRKRRPAPQIVSASSARAAPPSMTAPPTCVARRVIAPQDRKSKRRLLSHLIVSVYPATWVQHTRRASVRIAAALLPFVQPGWRQHCRQRPQVTGEFVLSSVREVKK